MMDVNGLFVDEYKKLFDEGEYTELIGRLDQFLDGITDKNIQIGEQILAQLWLGCCYLELAKKTKDIDEAEKLLKDAEKHYQKIFELIEHLTDEQEIIEVQINAKSWLAHCYFECAKRFKDTGETNSLFGRAVKYNKEIWTLAEQLEDTQIRIEEQTNVLFWFGVCHFEQAIRAKDMNNAGKSFKQAAAFFKRQLRLAGQLEDKQNRIQQQIFAQFRLSRCYIERIKRIKNTDKAEALFKKQAGKHLSAAHGQLSQLSNGTEQKRMEKIIRPGLRDIDYLNKDWISSFEKKKQEIQESLFRGKTSQPQDAVSTILAVLHITPIELGFTPMAHYTSPHVCHILFGIGSNETANPMRLGSSTYMNDPSEGKALLDLLNQQDLGLENKADGAPHNAFFICFSSRVNDLNQFRLYGKEGGVEASGCCLVFNKNGDWLREADVSVPFRSIFQKSGQNSDDLPKADKYEKLPLYQVAYIAYKDEYIAEKKCGIWLSAPNKAFNLHQNLAKENLGSSIRFTLNTNISRFGIRLKPVGNEEWHQFRLEKLKEALEELIRFFGDKSAVSDDDKEALEYIRYLFKDFAFRDEEEFRLLVIKPIDPKEIEYCEQTQSVYIPYADIRNLADEVILGTNYEKTGNQRKAEVFRYQMKQKCPDVKVSRSTLPINPPNK
ncbi:sel1 repeat family protein [Neisseria sicca]|uniref:sel1 repeat family protein n=1 Tax=Neisseria sicca TaxID=490 RepID=UPI001957E34E|nr:sel1 repeat family protein [Neisseria sicca]VTX66990.1 Uncharacterised protein [Neisseria sicca]